jgi:AcrR family transcriptional regulator
MATEASTDEVPPVRRRLGAEERREQLIALGVELVKQRPFDQTLVDEVIDSAGISKGLLFHYFPSKRAYQLAVMEAATSELVGLLEPDEQLPVLGQLSRGLDAYVAYIEQNPAGYLAIVRGAGSDDDLLALFEQTRDAIVDIVVGGLVRTGLATEEDPLLRLAARAWTASVEESTFLWLRDRPCTREMLLELLTRSALQMAPLVAELSTRDRS